MFRELIELGRQLESEAKLPPVGFKDYGEPIRWVAHLRVHPEPTIYLEEAERSIPRPYSGRRNNVRPHPVADEAAYVFANISDDRRAEKKHEAYLELLRKIIASPAIHDRVLKEALVSFKSAIERNIVERDERFGQVAGKDWISLVVDDGPLAGQHLFNHPEVVSAWADELGSSLSQNSGQCAVCGEQANLLRFIPSVKLQGMAPLHSLNADAFVSFIGLPNASKKAHVGVCYRCGDTAARAFNYLRDEQNHHRILLREANKLDSLNNHFALFWLKSPPSPVGTGEAELNWTEMLARLGDVISEHSEVIATPTPDVRHVYNLVSEPWKPRDASLNLDEYAFYLSLVSPNVGRIALRDWITISLKGLRENLSAFLTAIRIVGPWGNESYPISIRTAQWALEAAPGEPLISDRPRRIAKDTGIVRSMIRCAFLGQSPSPDIFKLAVPRCRKTEAKKPKDQRERHQQDQRRHALAALLKLILTFGKPEAKTMENLDHNRDRPAYLCGRLLAILEEAQLRAHRRRINTTLVDRAYGTACTAPASIFGRLIRGAETAHLPKIRKGRFGHEELKQLLEDVAGRLDELGGFPRTLAMHEQAEFALGFYHQRAHFRGKWGSQIAGDADETRNRSSDEE